MGGSGGIFAKINNNVIDVAIRTALLCNGRTIFEDSLLHAATHSSPTHHDSGVILQKGIMAIVKKAGSAFLMSSHGMSLAEDI